MARFSMNDADNYGNGGGSTFFSLKDDGDVANVRFMYNGAEDICGYAVHKIELDGKNKYVNCLRQYNEPRDNCPLCKAMYNQKAVLYIPLYDVDAGEVKLWERGKKFFAKVASLCSRYVKGNTPLVAHTFDIERHGKAGDQQTTYEIYETSCDDVRLEDLPEIPEVMGTLVLDKSFEELTHFVDYGTFPAEGNADTPQRGARRNEEQPTGRRTPSRRSSDAF